jgi:hypothetical protein
MEADDRIVAKTIRSSFASVATLTGTGDPGLNVARIVDDCLLRPPWAGTSRHPKSVIFVPRFSHRLSGKSFIDKA